MMIQSLFDVADMMFSPNSLLQKRIIGIIMRNDKGKIQIAYQFEEELSWHLQEEVIEVNNGK